MSESHINATKNLDKLYEFERAPVTQDRLQPGRYFAGLFAGEHVAGTEFVIGATFVAWGVNAYDVFIGLLLGNIMAVLTWTLVCAPIAVGTRLTLYWYLRRIAGPATTVVYNILNAVLFCILAGCMITVSASAVRIPFGIPAQVHWYPEDIRFVFVVLGLGAFVVALAILGFKKLAQFSYICSPWLFVMFLGGALVVLPCLAMNMDGGGQIRSWQDFWTIANKMIWTGQAPAGKESVTFWQVAAFAWICNLAMNAGLSDMALLRYAKSSSYGLYTAFGMLFGHYLAWIFAGIMGAGSAIILKTVIQQLDAGDVAYNALGFSGIIAVILAGWTTSNPTMYRAGLAFQAITPGWPRWLVTLVAGIATTIIAAFPFVFTRLLDFVGWYGLLLMPVGAIVFTEHWIFPKIGLTRYWAAYKNLTLSWPALASWVIAIATAFVLERTGAIHLFYLFVPIWCLTSVLYIVLSMFSGASKKYPGQPEPFTNDEVAPAIASVAARPNKPAGKDMLCMVSRVAAILSLAVCLFLAIWVFVASPDVYEARFDLFKKILIIPSLIYFVSATIWVVREDVEI